MCRSLGTELKKEGKREKKVCASPLFAAIKRAHNLVFRAEAEEKILSGLDYAKALQPDEGRGDAPPLFKTYDDFFGTACISPSSSLWPTHTSDSIYRDLQQINSS